MKNKLTKKVEKKCESSLCHMGYNHNDPRYKPHICDDTRYMSHATGVAKLYVLPDNGFGY